MDRLLQMLGTTAGGQNEPTLESTGLTLLVVPVVYTMIDDAQSWATRGTRRLLGRPEPLRAVKAPGDEAAAPKRRAAGDRFDSGSGI